MSILVLGGAGYIGSHTVYELINIGKSVVIVDNLSTGHTKSIHPSAKFYEGDIRDRNFLDNVFANEDIEGIIHFAASSLISESMANPIRYYDNNVCATKVLLESMLANNIDKIVFSSSASVYGDRNHVPLLESDESKPKNVLGETKLVAENMFKWADKAHSIKYVSMRYFNACGAHIFGNIGEDHRPETHLIPLIMQVANGKREFVSIYGDDYNTPDGTCIRDYIHVTDLAKAHILALDYLIGGGQSDVFNFGNGIGFSVMDVIKYARIITGHPIPTKIEPRRVGDPARLIASSAKAKEILKWEPKSSQLDTIIQTAWKWHSSYPNGY